MPAATALSVGYNKSKKNRQQAETTRNSNKVRGQPIEAGIWKKEKKCESQDLAIGKLWLWLYTLGPSPVTGP